MSDGVHTLKIAININIPPATERAPHIMIVKK